MSTTSNFAGSTRAFWMAGLTLAAIAFLPSCTVIPVDDGWEIGPARRGPGLLRDVRVIGEHCIENRCFDLLDADGDGSPDFAREPGSRRWYPIKAPMAGEVGGSLNHASLQTLGDGHSNADSGDDGNGGGGGSATTHRRWDWWRTGLSDRIRWDFELPELYDFGGATAETIIAQKGLDIEPGVTAFTTALSVELFDTESLYTEATLFWTSAFEMPEEFDDLGGQITVLESNDPEGIDLYAIQLRGDIRDVGRVLLEVQDEECPEARYLFESEGSSWSVVSDATARTLSLYTEGVLVMTLSVD